MKKIAELCGVSEATVSKALRDRPDVGAKTRKRILSIADQYHYRPNALVRSLQRKRTMTVGIAQNDYHTEFASTILVGALHVLTEHDYEAFIIHWDNKTRDGNHALRSMHERRVDGIMVHPPPGMDPKTYLTEMRAFHAPMVLIHKSVPHMECDFIGTDDALGAYAITKHLIELGHRKIACTYSQVEMTFDGFRDAMMDHGLPVRREWLMEGQYYEETCTRVREWLSAEDRPTAVIGFNDVVALKLYGVAADLGLRIPRDVSITGFANLSIAQELRPRMTTVEQDAMNIGRQAARMLLRRINEKIQDASELPADPRTLLQPTQLIVRESTAPPRIAP